MEALRQTQQLQSLQPKMHGALSNAALPAATNTAGSSQAKIDDSTHFITNLVYVRDPSIIDQKTITVNQRDAF